jgi:hypothetical protein
MRRLGLLVEEPSEFGQRRDWFEVDLRGSGQETGSSRLALFWSLVQYTTNMLTNAPK